MTRKITLMSGAALALCLPAVPALAESHAATPDRVEAQRTMVEPTVRYIRRDADGNVVFDSMAASEAPGASDPAIKEAIEQADGPTTGETDTAPVRMAADGTTEAGTDDAMSEDMERRMTAAGAGGAADTPVEEMAATAIEGTEGVETPSPMATTDLDVAGGVPSPDFDVEAFAREMFEQGYRQGYVRAMTETRAAGVRQMQQQMDRGQFMDRDRFRQQARDTRQGMREMLRVTDGENETILVLPAGMTTQQFLRSMNR